MQHRAGMLTRALLSCAAVLAVPGAASAHPTLDIASDRPETSTYPLGSAVTLTVTVAGLADHDSRNLTVVVKDETGATLQTLGETLRPDAAGRATYVLHAPQGRLGYYEVHAQTGDGVTNDMLGSRPAGIFSYAVVPDPALRERYPSSLSRFGMQGGFSIQANVIPLLGVRWMLDREGWIMDEKDHPGQYTAQAALQTAVVAKRTRDAAPMESVTWQGKPWPTYSVSTIATASIPDWARLPGTEGKVSKTFGALNDKGEAAITAYAAQQAKAARTLHGGTSPRYYQVTWEPFDNWGFGGTPAQLVEYYARTYKAIHQADPDALVAGPTLFIDKGSNEQLRGLFAAGLGQYIDVLSIHPYGPVAPARDSYAGLLHEQLAMARAGAHGRPIGLIGTEHGVESGKVGLVNQAWIDLHYTLTMLGEGAALDVAFYVADFKSNRFETYGYYWNVDQLRNFGAQRLSPKPVAPAFAAMTWLLDGSEATGAVSGLTGTQSGYRFSRKGKTTSVYWDEGAGSQLRLPGAGQLCDWMGNCHPVASGTLVKLSQAPVYFIA